MRRFNDLSDAGRQLARRLETLRGQPELAFGAIGEGGVRVKNDAGVRDAHLGDDDIEAAESAQRAELQRRSERFRGGHDRVSLTGRTAVVVDDGVAPGATAKAACEVARAQGASKILLAVPIGATDIAERFEGCADEVVCLETSEFYFAVGPGAGAEVSDRQVGGVGLAPQPGRKVR